MAYLSVAPELSLKLFGSERMRDLERCKIVLAKRVEGYASHVQCGRVSVV